MAKSMYENLSEEVPEHLEPLKKILYSGCFFQEDDKDYARIGFKLLEVANGDKEAIKEVSTFIQRERQRLRSLENTQKTLIEQSTQWLYWAKNWTMRKTESK